MNWVSVKDRYPDSGKQTEVLFYANPYEFWTGLYTPKGYAGETGGCFQYHQHWGDDSYHTIKNVTHWMEIPVPE